MGDKRTKSKKNIKINKKIILILLILIIIIIGIIKSGTVNVGKINNEGKAEYIEKVVSVTKFENKKIIEFKNEYELIDNGIITTEIYEKIKNNDNTYNLELKDYLKMENISAKESYNINKAMQLDIVTENTKYETYFAKTCGFKNKKELLKYTEAVFELADKEK